MINKYRQQFVFKIKELQPQWDGVSINKFLSYVVGASLFGLIYIFNAHQTVKKVRAIDQTNFKLKELRAEYISTLSDLSKRSTMSEVQAELGSTGLTDLKVPPFVIKKSEK